MNFLISKLIYLKHKFPFLWNAVESVNGVWFSVVFPSYSPKAKKAFEKSETKDFVFSEMSREDIPELLTMINSLPEGYLQYFNPHAFDEKTFRRLLDNRSYLLMKVREKASGKIAGYFFLRGMAIGKKVFMGLLVDNRFKGRGLGREMWRIGAEISHDMGLKMFATVSSRNLPSLESAKKGTDVTVKDTLDNDYLLIQCAPKQET